MEDFLKAEYNVLKRATVLSTECSKNDDSHEGDAYPLQPILRTAVAMGSAEFIP